MRRRLCICSTPRGFVPVIKSACILINSMDAAQLASPLKSAPTPAFSRFGPDLTVRPPGPFLDNRGSAAVELFRAATTNSLAVLRVGSSMRIIKLQTTACVDRSVPKGQCFVSESCVVVRISRATSQTRTKEMQRAEREERYRDKKMQCFYYANINPT